MKRTLLIIALMFAVAMSQSYAQDAQKKTLGAKPKTEVKQETKAPAAAPAKEVKKPGKAAKPTKGKIVSISRLYKGTMEMNKGIAQKCVEAGDPLVLLVGEGKKGKVYFILENDGSFSGKKLANYAGNKMIAVFGKIKTVNGLNYIVEDQMESAD